MFKQAIAMIYSRYLTPERENTLSCSSPTPALCPDIALGKTYKTQSVSLSWTADSKDLIGDAGSFFFSRAAVATIRLLLPQSKQKLSGYSGAAEERLQE